jgi:hypothetical protein
MGSWKIRLPYSLGSPVPSALIENVASFSAKQGDFADTVLIHTASLSQSVDAVLGHDRDIPNDGFLFISSDHYGLIDLSDYDSVSIG